MSPEKSCITYDTSGNCASISNIKIDVADTSLCPFSHRKRKIKLNFKKRTHVLYMIYNTGPTLILKQRLALFRVVL